MSKYSFLWSCLCLLTLQTAGFWSIFLLYYCVILKKKTFFTKCYCLHLDMYFRINSLEPNNLFKKIYQNLKCSEKLPLLHDCIQSTSFIHTNIFMSYTLPCWTYSRQSLRLTVTISTVECCCINRTVSSSEEEKAGPRIILLGPQSPWRLTIPVLVSSVILLPSNHL